MSRRKPLLATTSPKPYTFAPFGRADANCATLKFTRRKTSELDTHLHVLILKHQRKTVKRSRIVYRGIGGRNRCGRQRCNARVKEGSGSRCRATSDPKGKWICVMVEYQVGAVFVGRGRWRWSRDDGFWDYELGFRRVINVHVKSKIYTREETLCAASFAPTSFAFRK